jgi:hypothetical protein
MFELLKCWDAVSSMAGPLGLLLLASGQMVAAMEGSFFGPPPSGPDLCYFSGIPWWCPIGRDAFPPPALALPLHSAHPLAPCYPIAGDSLYVACRGTALSSVPRDLLPATLTYLKISDTNITHLRAGELVGIDIQFLSVTDNPLVFIDG